ncbi:MAG: hypothetical protein ACRC5D_08050 [Aeromonas allosaccharophila]
MSVRFYFDVDQLIVDLGGVMHVARALDIPREYLWAWRKEGRLPSKRWVEIKTQWPQVKFDKYFKPIPTDMGEGHQ